MIDHKALAVLGWDGWFEANFNSFAPEGSVPARVMAQHRGAYLVNDGCTDIDCELAGRLLHEARAKADLPTVGDWVALRPTPTGDTSLIVHVVERRTKFCRKQAGQLTQTSKGLKGVVAEQVVAANIDFLLVVTALNNEFNVRRLERYLATALDGGCQPVIVLTKADLCQDASPTIELIRAVDAFVDIVVTSVVNDMGIDELLSYLRGNRTVAMVGSSGVGKSSLINRILGDDVLAVNETRDDDRGRHTTTHRELFKVDGGGLVIDTPGMRELHLWGADDGIAESFSDIVEIAAGCRFSNCAHHTEPGCAVKEALDDGSLDVARYRSYQKLNRELAAINRRSDYRAAAEHKRKWKAIVKASRPPRGL